MTTMVDSTPARRRIALGFAAIAALTLASCATQSRPVAQVGPRTITAADLVAFASTAHGQYAWQPDSAKRMLLDDLIRRDLMLLEAEQRGVTQDTQLVLVRHAAEQELLLGALTEQLAPQNVPVSEAEIATFYDWHRTEHHLQVIHAATPLMAGQALARLRSGEPFRTVATAFNSSGVVPPDGDLGWIPGGAMPEPLDTRIREARVGELVGPVPAGDNWFIVRVLERRAGKLPPLASVQAEVLAQLKQRKHRAVVQHAIQTLKDEYRVRLEPGGGQELFMRANRPAGDSTAAIQAEDSGVVLARYDTPAGEARLTMADALGDLQSQSDRPNFSSLPSIQRWIESRVVQRLVVIEAHRRHLNEVPDIERAIQDRVDSRVLQSIFEAQVTSRLHVTEDDLRAEYLRRVQSPTAPPYESVPPEVKEQLRTFVVEGQRDAILRVYTDQLKRKYPVTVHESELKRVQLPPPEIVPGMPQG